jgi:hypothetical protein
MVDDVCSSIIAEEDISTHPDKDSTTLKFSYEAVGQYVFKAQGIALPSFANVHCIRKGTGCRGYRIQ